MSRYTHIPLKRLLSFLAISLLLTHGALAENKVLFMGNSYTYGSGGTQSVPDIFDALANAGGQADPTTVMRAVGGKDYQYHYENSQTHIAQEQWTHVIMQNLSTEPTHVGDISDHNTYGTLLYNSIIANNSDTQVMLYMTWARQESHSLITGTSTSSSFESTDEMLDELRTNYDALAASLTAANPTLLPIKVNPAGVAFMRAGGNLVNTDPNYIDLFSDGTHANDLGYYLSACVHYSSIYKSSPVGLFSEAEIVALGLSITSNEAAFLEQIAWDTIANRGILDSTTVVDFGVDAQATASAPVPGETWNNVTASQASTSNAVVSDLLTIEGAMSSTDLTIISRFNSTHTDGTTASTLYPSSATIDTVFGNTESINGLSEISPTLTLSSLDPSTPITLAFYASRTGTSDNQQTRYTVTGSQSTAVDLDTHDNIDQHAQTEAIYPNASGEITIQLSAGPDNTNAHHITNLGVLEFTAYPYSDLSFVSQPSSQTVAINDPFTLTATVNSTRDVQAQWYADGTPINGATSLSYSIATATAGLDGTEYNVTITNGLFTLTSATATLTLESDTNPPEINAFTLTAANTIELTFNEALDATSATDASNYIIANQGIRSTISNITLSPDGTTVTLTLAEGLEGHFLISPQAGITDTLSNALASDTILQGYQPIPGDATIYIDFGSSFSVSGETETWNQASISSGIRSTVDGGTPHIFVTDLLDSINTATGIGLQMTNSMTATNSAGTDTSGIYPAGATQDSFFGQTGDFGGYTDDGQGIFEFTGCDPQKFYDFTIYSSRIGGSENRETHYSITGTQSKSGDLTISQNMSESLTLTQIQPTAAGVITLTVSAGANNNHSKKFYYLGLLEINAYVPASEPSLYTPVPVGSQVYLDWKGDAALQYTNDLLEAWTTVDPSPTAPYIDTTNSPQRFYQLSIPN